jgi:raffinose/stachyose/melibiose transport system permease protein
MGYQALRRIVLAAYAIAIVIPLTVVLFGTFKDTAQLFANPFAPPSSLPLTNYDVVLTEQNLGRVFLNSVIVTVSSVALTLFIASMAAYAAARIHGWRGWLIYGFLVLGMSVPAQTNMIPQYVLFQRIGLLDSLLGLILINIVVTLPVAVFILGAFMRTLPKEIYEATAIDGSGPWRTYRSVVMPLSMPSVAATGIFLFVIHWNELLYPLLFINSPEKKTLPVALLDFQGEFLTNYPLLFTGVLIASLPLVITYLVLQRYFVQGITAGAVKG